MSASRDPKPRTPRQERLRDVERRQIVLDRELKTYLDTGGFTGSRRQQIKKAMETFIKQGRVDTVEEAGQAWKEKYVPESSFLTVWNSSPIPFRGDYQLLKTHDIRGEDGRLIKNEPYLPDLENTEPTILEDTKEFLRDKVAPTAFENPKHGMIRFFDDDKPNEPWQKVWLVPRDNVGAGIYKPHLTEAQNILLVSNVKHHDLMKARGEAWDGGMWDIEQLRQEMADAGVRPASTVPATREGLPEGAVVQGVVEPPAPPVPIVVD